VPLESRNSRRNLSIALAALFLAVAAFLYDISGFRSNLYGRWSYEHRVRIGTLPLSISDYYFSSAVFFAVCGVVYFVLCSIARRRIELFLGYAHFLLSAAVVALAAFYIRGLTPSDPLQTIPSSYYSVFLLAQILFAAYVAMAVFSPPPDDGL
jgi:hypothetical protein